MTCHADLMKVYAGMRSMRKKCIQECIDPFKSILCTRNSSEVLYYFTCIKYICGVWQINQKINNITQNKSVEAQPTGPPESRLPTPDLLWPYLNNE